MKLLFGYFKLSMISQYCICLRITKPILWSVTEDKCDLQLFRLQTTAVWKSYTYCMNFLSYQVRDVRNLWGHCNFNEWEAVRYSNSFQLMTNLVKNLCLSSNEENKILLEMKKMEINGNKLIINSFWLKNN